MRGITVQALALGGMFVGAARLNAAPLEADAPRPRALEVSSRFGIASAPLEHETLHHAHGHGATLVLGGQLTLARVTLGAELPLVVASVAQPAGAFVDRSAVANPELFASWSSVRPREALVLTSTLRMSLTLPLAAWDPSDVLLTNRALAIGDALEGWSRQDRYAPRRLGAAASVETAAVAGWWALGARARVPVLVRTGALEQVEGWSTGPVALAPAAAAFGRVWATPR
jgi:hypothetical protein